jgi:hypothetical protein
VTLDASELVGKLKEMPKETITRGLQLTAQDLINNLMQNSPVDHGLLKQWAVTSQTDNEIIIQSPAEYAVYQNYGTNPYIIQPKNRKALFWPGAEHPVKMVHHPGIKGKHFVEDSIEATQTRIQEFFTINGG